MRTAVFQETAKTQHSVGLAGPTAMTVELRSDSVYEEQLRAMMRSIVTPETVKQLSRKLVSPSPSHSDDIPSCTSGPKLITITVNDTTVHLTVTMQTHTPRNFRSIIVLVHQLLAPALTSQLVQYWHAQRTS